MSSLPGLANRFLLRVVWRGLFFAFVFTLVNRSLGESESNWHVFRTSFCMSLLLECFDLWIRRRTAGGKDAVPPLVAILLCFGFLVFFWHDLLTGSDRPAGWEWLGVILFSLLPLCTIIGASWLILKRWRERKRTLP